MRKVCEILKEKWYLVFISIAVSIPLLPGIMVSIWVIAVATESLVFSVLSNVFVATFIANLPLYPVYRCICKEMGRWVMVKVAVVIYISYYIIFGSMVLMGFGIL